MVFNNLCAKLRNLALMLTIGSIPIAPVCKVAISAFNIEPAFSPVVLKPNMVTFTPIPFLVINNTTSDIPSVHFHTYNTSLLLSTTLVNNPNGTTTPPACTKNMVLNHKSKCIIYLKILTGITPGKTKTGVKVCGFNGFLCAGKLVDVNIEDTNKHVPIYLKVTLDKLPENIEKDFTYPVMYTVENTSNTLPATKVHITFTNETISTHDALKSFIPSFNDCHGSIGSNPSFIINPGETCHISGEYKPIKEGKQKLSFTLKYAEAKEGPNTVQTTETTTNVTDVAIEGKVVTPLDTNMHINTKKAVSFIFNNKSDTLPATELKWGTGSLKNFTQSNNSCIDDKTKKYKTELPPGGSCEITGEYTSGTDIGNHSIAVGLTYREGNPVKVETKTNVTNVNIIGSVSKLAENTLINHTYPLIFRFTNMSELLPATNIKLIKDFSNQQQQFFNIKDSCLSLKLKEIKPGKSCEITGDFKPSSVGQKELTVTLQYTQGADVILRKKTTVNKVSITGKSDKLPDDIGNTKTQHLRFTFTNSSSSSIFPATNIKVHQVFPDGTKNIKDNCTDKPLAQGSSCDITADYTPKITKGPVNFSAILSYNEGQPVEVTAKTNVTQIVVKGKVTPLPTNTEKDRSYPVEFTFKNTNEKLKATISRITKNLDDFTAKTDSCFDKNDKPIKVLDAAGPSGTVKTSSCEISGVYEPKKANGPDELSVTLKYDESDKPVELHAPTAVTDVEVDNTVPTNLPKNIEKDRTYPLIFTFSNSNMNLPATNLVWTPDKSSKLKGFTETFNSCMNKTELSPNSYCQIEGNYKPTISSGTEENTISLSYDESGGNPIESQVTTTVTDVNITQKTTPLPANMAKGIKKPVTFTFTNSNTTLPATNISFIKILPHFKITNNTCKKTLAPNKSCEIGGEYEPTTLGPEKLSVILNYDEGSQVEAHAETDVVNVAIEGTVTKTLPANILAGKKQNVTFQFTNKSTQLEATGIKYTTISPNNFKETKNDCTTKKLAPNASCEIAGDYDPKNTLGPKDLTIRLEYKEGAPVVLSTITNVTTVSLSGTVLKQLPDNTRVNVGYPVSFMYTNTSQLPATNLHFTSAVPANFKINTNQCFGKTNPNKTLAARSSCEITGTYTPQKTGTETLNFNLEYDEGSPVPLSTDTTTTAVNIKGEINFNGTLLTQSANQVTVKGLRYPLIFSFTNESTLFTANITSITDPTHLNSFKLLSNSCGTGSLKLAPGGNCQIAGYYEPDKTTINTPLVITLAYKEGSDVTLTFTPTIENIGITTDFTSTDPKGHDTSTLPANTVLGDTYDLTFNFTNTSKTQPATHVYVIKDIPGFKETKNNCNVDKINATDGCTIKGKFKPSREGTQTPEVTFYYKEGDPVTITKTTKVINTKPIEGKVGWMVKGDMHAFPEYLEPNHDYKIAFDFRNNSENDLTNITFTNNFSNKSSISDITDNCSNLSHHKLTKHSMCFITAKLNYGSALLQTIEVKVKYDISHLKNQKFTLHVTALTTKTPLVSKITTNLAPTGKVGVPQNFTVKFTNEGSSDVTLGDTILASSNPNGQAVFVNSPPSTPNKSKCSNKKLSSGKYCEVQASYTAQDKGPQTVFLMQPYNKGTTIFKTFQIDAQP